MGPKVPSQRRTVPHSVQISSDHLPQVSSFNSLFHTVNTMFRSWLFTHNIMTEPTHDMVAPLQVSDGELQGLSCGGCGASDLSISLQEYTGQSILQPFLCENILQWSLWRAILPNVA